MLAHVCPQDFFPWVSKLGGLGHRSPPAGFRDRALVGDWGKAPKAVDMF